jgi:glycerophosphoryl diester phosphodiesterase
VRRLSPELVTSASSPESYSALRRSYFCMRPRRPAFQLFQVPVRLRGKPILTRRFVRTARRAGLPVQVWVVDEIAEMRRLIDWGVTGIISDRPDRAMQVKR